MSDNLGLWEVMGAANFMIQLIGVVKVQRLVQRRLFVFLFAGEDCVLDKRDEIRMRMYNALLAQKVHQVTNSFVHFSVVMLNFSDYDFQKLVLNTRQCTPTTSPNTTSTQPTSKAAWF